MKGTVSTESIVSIFTRHGREGRRAKLACNFSRFEHDYLAGKAGLAADEEPALGGVGADPVWWLLTTRRLVWSDGAVRHEVAIADLARVTHDMSAAVRRGQLDRRQWTDLDIAGVDGPVGRLTLEPGGAFLGTWHVLQWLVKRAGKWRRQEAA